MEESAQDVVALQAEAYTYTEPVVQPKMPEKEKKGKERKEKKEKEKKEKKDKEKKEKREKKKQKKDDAEKKAQILQRHKDAVASYTKVGFVFDLISF